MTESVIEKMARAMNAAARERHRYDWDRVAEYYKNICGEQVRAALSAALDAGWQLVPKEPTEEMLKAGDIEIDISGACDEVYRAMLEKAPKP